MNAGAVGRRSAGSRARLALLAGGVLGLFPPAAMAAGPPAPAADYPASDRAEDVLKWTTAATSIKPAAVLAVTPQLVAALDKVQMAGEGLVLASLREEVVDPLFAQKADGRSLTTNVEFDCRARRFRFMGEVTYPRPNLQGSPRYTDQSDGWAQVREDGIIGRLFATVCPKPAVVVAASAPVATPAPAAPASSPASLPVSAPPAPAVIRTAALTTPAPAAKPSPATPPPAAAPPFGQRAAAVTAPAMKPAPAAPPAAPAAIKPPVALAAASAPPAASAPAKPPMKLAALTPPAAPPGHAEAPPPAPPAAKPPEAPMPAARPAPSHPYTVMAGAFAVPANAQARAAALAGKAPQVAVRTIEVGTKRWSLVEVTGFEDHAAAAAFCAAVSKQPADCIVRPGHSGG